MTKLFVLPVLFNWAYCHNAGIENTACIHLVHVFKKQSIRKYSILNNCIYLLMAKLFVLPVLFNWAYCRNTGIENTNCIHIRPVSSKQFTASI